MFFSRRTNRRAANSAGVSSRFAIGLLSVGLLSGCGEVGSPLADSAADSQPSAAWTQVSNEVNTSNTSTTELSTLPRETDKPPQLAAKMPAIDFLPPANSNRRLEPAPEEMPTLYWSFSTQEVDNSIDSSGEHPPVLIPLPTLDELPTEEVFAPEQPIAHLLPPQPVIVEPMGAPESSFTFSESKRTEIPTAKIAPPAESPLPVTAKKLTDQEQLLSALLQDASSAATGVLTNSRVNELAKTKIQQAYAMAGRGALYVARQELIEVLRMISQAKDAQQGTPERTVALAAGLRALREAEDFSPRGTQLEAELEIGVLCASHRTPMAKQPEFAQLLPRLMMDRYLRYAQLQLALSVAGEPAGSMALHALGKLHSQWGRLEPEKHRLADRRAIAYQQAALFAHNQNYLAAHELGVLLATSGHFAEAEQLLLQVAAREPNAVVYRNLARVQEKLGQAEQALSNRDFARQLSRQGATGTNNVQWVSPAQFSQGSIRTPRYSTAQRPAANSLVIPGSRSTTQRR